MIYQHKDTVLQRLLKEKDFVFENGKGERIVIKKYQDEDMLTGNYDADTEVVAGQDLFDKLSIEAQEELEDIVNDNF